MDGEMKRRWRGGLSPFDGQTVSFDAEDLVPLTPLCQAFSAVVSRLRDLWPEASLLSLNDWHEHDGYGTGGKPTFWTALASALVSEYSLITLSTNEWEVRKAFFPETHDFYLRIYVMTDIDDDYPEPCGDFDVTCAPPLAAELAERASKASGFPVARQEAKTFFDRRYGG